MTAATFMNLAMLVSVRLRVLVESELGIRFHSLIYQSQISQSTRLPSTPTPPPSSP